MDNTLTLAHKKSLYQDIVLKFLSRMDRGRLVLELPGGDRMIIGDGKDPVTASIVVRDPAFFKRCILYGDIGFGESYVEGYWDTDDITRVIAWALLNVDNTPGVSGSRARSIVLNILRWWNKRGHRKHANTLHGSKKNIAEHYDLNNDFFRLFLDPTLTYSSAYFAKNEMSLETFFPVAIK